MIVRFTSFFSGMPEQEFAVTAFPATVGRGRDAQVRLDDPGVSRHHCQLDQVDGLVVVRDLNSKNGTFIDGLLSKEKVLLPGHELRVGLTRLVAHYQASNSN
jgi:pSer/pThr/pTyr-binding forkhead associated (FHA) protein